VSKITAFLWFEDGAKVFCEHVYIWLNLVQLASVVIKIFAFFTRKHQ